MDGIIGTMTANEAQIEGTGEKVKFPLAGFCENYLMQFVK